MDINEKIAIAQKAVDAGSACPELKAAAKAFIENPSSENEKALVAEAKEDINTIDDTIGFFSSPKAAEIFGEAAAAEKLAQVKAAKAAGEKYCNCPGCAAAKEIIENLE